MKKIITLIFILVALSTTAFAERSVKGFESIDEFRTIGEFRLWTFIAKDSVIGTYLSTVKEQVNINGVAGVTLEQKLKLDYTKIATNLTFNIINRHFIAQDGMYLGDDMKIGINDQNEELHVKRDGSNLTGFITRNDSKIDQEIDLRNIKFAIENNYIDQLEMYLASLDLTVGTQINDTIFMSQTMIESNIVGVVTEFKNVRLYNEVFDSSFVIEFTYPTMMTAIFTPDKRLAKLIVPSQELKIYQDAVRNPLKEKLEAINSSGQTQNTQAPKLVRDQSFVALLIAFVFYLIAGLIVCMFFMKNLYKKPIAYIAFAIGGLSFIIIPFTQFPLQEMFFQNYFVPHVLQAGESAIMWGILPALTAGLMQGILIVVILFYTFKLLEVKKSQYVSVGAIIGFGFGIFEALFLAYGIPASLLFGINLVERIFLIIFHISAALVISYALRESMQKAVTFLVVTILLNSLLRYLPIFVQSKTLTPELLGIVLAFLSISFLTYSLYLAKKED